MNKVRGRYAVNAFCKNLPTILGQYGKINGDQASTNEPSDNWPQAVPKQWVRKVFNTTFVGDDDWIAAQFNENGLFTEGNHRVLFINPDGKRSADVMSFKWSVNHWNVSCSGKQ